MRETRITIGDNCLTEAQSMTVRVAVTSFQWEMADIDALGDDDEGRAMVRAYRERLAEIVPMLVRR